MHWLYILIPILLLQGCFTDWSKRDKLKFSGFVALQVIDTYQSVEFIRDDNELNSLYKSNEALALGKIISTGLIYWVADYFPEVRPTLLNIGCGLMSGVVIWNFTQ